MIILTTCSKKFRINKEAWPSCSKQELESILESLTDWINYNEELMTENQFNKAIKIKAELEEYIKKA